MKSKHKILNSKFLIAIITLLCSSSLFSRMYNPYVWTTYKEFFHIYSISLNMTKVYFGTDGGFLRYDRLQSKWDTPVTKSDGFTGEKAKIVAFDKLFNKLWIVSDNAIMVFNPQISRWEREIPRISLPFTVITSIGFTPDYVFLEGNGLIYFSQRGSFAWEKWTGALPSNIDWSGEKGKISIRDYPFLTPFYATDEYFNKYKYTAAAVDNKDMWIGTNGYGVFHNNIFTWNGRHYIIGLANNRVDAIFHDAYGFWIGGRYGTGKGITHINFETGEGKHFNSKDVFRLNSNDVYAIYGDEKNIWFGTNAGLHCYRKDELDWKNYTQFDALPGEIVISLIIKEDTLFIGTNNGMAFMLPGSKEIISVEEFDNTSVNAFGIYNNNLIIGTDRGVFLKKNKKFEIITDPDGDFRFGVTTIFVDKDALWFGTRRKGVDIYYPDSSQWEEYLYPSPISGEWVFAISGNNDYVWICTNFGVTRYNKKLKSWHTFNESDGLSDNEVRTVYIEDDYVWFGTKSGLTRFKYRDSSVPP
ncbi:hypothetical protein KAX75_02595 [candidate division WOR-3 bacterium]|nr:hypothetical protein [candidate division WOR-3 bacterium]